MKMSEKKYIDADYLRQFVMPIKDHTGKIERIVLYKDVEAAPAADVEKVKHGMWINTGHGGIHGDYIYECSYCKNEREAYVDEENYCPNCGAKMDMEE